MAAASIPHLVHVGCGGQLSNETLTCDRCHRRVNDSSRWAWQYESTTVPCYLCMGSGGGHGGSDCLCCGGAGGHTVGQQPDRCRRARRNAMGESCTVCGALWDEECDCEPAHRSIGASL